MKQYDAAKMDEAKEAAIIQVVAPAIEPDHKSSPHRALIVLLFTIVGFFAGCILALFLWWKELVQSDPATAGRIQEFRYALTNKRGTIA
jgi:uncharacterized protein involved in exopolysaccharide biosynthesis